MKISPSAVIDHARSEQGRKQIRYAAVSVVFVPVGQILIQVLGAMVFDRDYTKASIVAAAILTVPNFFANKMWVWKDTSRDKLRTQVLVFWVAAMLGVAAATGLTYLVEQQFHNEGAVEALAVFCAQLVEIGRAHV